MYLTKCLVQPGAPAWGHALTKGLVAAWYPQVQSDGLSDILEQHDLGYSGPIGPGVNRLGRVLSARGAGGQATAPAKAVLRPGAVSLVWYGTLDGPPTGSTYLLGVGDVVSPSYALTRSAAGIGLAWGGQSITASVSVPTGTPVVVIGTIDATGAGTLYVNNNLAAQAAGQPLAYSGGSVVYAPGSPSNGDAAASVAVQYVYNRALTPDDVGALTIDPYAVLRTPKRRLFTRAIYTPTVVGTAAVTSGLPVILAGATVTNIGVAGSGAAQPVLPVARGVGIFAVQPVSAAARDLVDPFIATATGTWAIGAASSVTVGAFIGRAVGAQGVGGSFVIADFIGSFVGQAFAGHGVSDYWHLTKQPTVSDFVGSAGGLTGDYVATAIATVDRFTAQGTALHGQGASGDAAVGAFVGRAFGNAVAIQGVASPAQSPFVGRAAGIWTDTGYAWTQVDAWTAAAAGSSIAYIGAAADLLGIQGVGQGRIAPVGHGSGVSVLPTAVALGHVYPSIVGANRLQTVVGPDRVRVAHWPPYQRG